MANNELTKSKASSKIEESLIKLTFLSDVIYNNLSKGVYVLNAEISLWFV